MAEPSRHVGEQHFRDAVTFMDTTTLPAGCVTNAMVNAAAAIAATKLEHQHAITIAQESDQTATAEKRPVHSVYGATGTIVSFEAGCVTLCTSTSTVSVDLLKNGTSVLSSVISLDSADTARSPSTGTVSTTTLADGDLLEVQISPLGPDACDFTHMEDFLKDAGDTLPDIWGVNGKTANSTEDYVTDSPAGEYSLIQSSDSEGQASQLTAGNVHWIDLFEKPIIEWRCKLDLTGTNALGSADQRLVIGVCNDHTNAEDALDDVTVNAWFRMEGTSANIYVEADDASTNTDDQDSTVNLVNNTWNLFWIDFSNLADVKFYINGTEQGGAAVVMSNISSSTVVQPICCIQRDAGAEEEKICIDSFRVVKCGREAGTLGKGVFATVHFREDAA